MLGRSIEVTVFAIELLHEYLDDCNDHHCRRSWKDLSPVSETEWLTWKVDSGNERCSIASYMRALESAGPEYVLGTD